MLKKILFTSLFFLSAVLFCSCADKSPVATISDDYDDRTEDAYDHVKYISSSSSAKRSSSSHYNYDDYYSSSSISSSSHYSSSSVLEFDYLTTSKTLNFTLTYYEQTSTNWDASSNSYSDGDPKISFVIHFIQSNGTETSFSTKNDIDKKWFYKEDINKWEGRLSFVTSVPALTDTIKVCPTVVDVDIMFDDDKSSGYCYYTAHIGRNLKDREIVKQEDYQAEDYRLKWEWYLY